MICPGCQHKNQPGSRFCAMCGSSLLAAQDSALRKNESRAERRPLTVMFCDLVDSTTIVDSLDPEETRSIIRHFQCSANQVIDQFGGRITEYLGDGIVALFTHHESNAERAIKAGLNLISRFEDDEIIIGTSATPIQLRCGIATGMAIVGDMLGDARIRVESAIGLPLNLAARIQSLAKPNEVVVAGDIYHLTQGLFEFKDLGKHELKGITDPRRIWRVVKEKQISSRFLAHTAQMTPMVDREEPMEVLLNCWESCKRNVANAVVFTGEAGIGKSRILQELGKCISQDDFFYQEYQCAPYHSNTALYPLISRLEVAAGFNRTDSYQQKQLKIEHLVSLSSTDMKFDMPSFITLLGLPGDDKWPMPNLDPDERKQRLFTTLVNNMHSLAEKKPLLIKIEDVHWIDPTTLELINQMVISLKTHKILLLITSRPGFEADFLNASNVALLEVDRLPEEYSAKLIQGMQGVDQLPQNMIEEILKRTEGIPLFAEELSKSLMEGFKPGEVSGNTKPGLHDIPTTLHDSLLARLDRLPKASRSVAQFASVIGRDFTLDLLGEITDVRAEALQQLLTPLFSAQLVYQEKIHRENELRFKHALVRDAAYENLLQSERVDIHRRIAEAIEDKFPELIEKSPELPARHFTEGKCYDKAVKYWLEAGKKASQQYALIEAREHLETGLLLLAHLPETAMTKTTKLEILITLGPVLIAMEGAGAALTRDNYTRAVRLGDQLPESTLQFKALWGQWQVSMDYKGDNGLVWSDRLEHLSTKLGEDELILQAHHCQWTTRFHLGQFSRAGQHIVDGLELYQPDSHQYLAQSYGGHDPKVCGHGFISQVLWFQGKETKAVYHSKQCYAHAKKLGHLGSVIHSVELNLLLALLRSEPNAIATWCKKLNGFCQKMVLPETKGKLLCANGKMLVDNKNHTQGINNLMAGIAELKQVGTTEDIPFFTEMLARSLATSNRTAEAISYIDDILALYDQNSCRYWQAEVIRRKGTLLMQLDNDLQARDCFLESYRIASNQGALALQLRAAKSLFEYHQRSGLMPDASKYLLATINSFSEDSDSVELRRAQCLLNV